MRSDKETVQYNTQQILISSQIKYLSPCWVQAHAVSALTGRVGGSAACGVRLYIDTAHIPHTFNSALWTHLNAVQARKCTLAPPVEIMLRYLRPWLCFFISWIYQNELQHKQPWQFPSFRDVLGLQDVCKWNKSKGNKRKRKVKDRGKIPLKVSYVSIKTDNHIKCFSYFKMQPTHFLTMMLSIQFKFLYRH